MLKGLPMVALCAGIGWRAGGWTVVARTSTANVREAVSGGVLVSDTVTVNETLPAG